MVHTLVNLRLGSTVRAAFCSTSSRGLTDTHRCLQTCASTKALQELDDITDERTQLRRNKLRYGKYEVRPAHDVPTHIPKPSWYHGRPASQSSPPEIHDVKGMEKMRRVGRLAADILDFAETLVQPGITTEEIDQAVHDMAIQNGAYPSPLFYGSDPPFPKSVCTSVNECVCHGIPDMRPLDDGDVVNVDVTVWLDGYHGDTSRTFYVGQPSSAAQNLVEATQEALDAGIAVCRPGADFREIGRAIEDVVKRRKYKVSRDFIGHGVGREFHASPPVLPFKNSCREGEMQVGQTFTIEPILHAGKTANKAWPDGWTIVAADGTLTAQFEHTLLITDSGVERLTLGREEAQRLGVRR